jgi:hypothetical protein
MAKDGLDGLGKMRKGEKAEYTPKPKEGGMEKPEHEAGSSTTIEHHPDGTHSVDGEKMPDHLHALAHIGHKITGGDKHHIVHHDGMEAHSHSIHEDGTHEPHQEDAHSALDKFMGESQEPEREQMQESQPEFGGM